MNREREKREDFIPRLAGFSVSAIITFFVVFSVFQNGVPNEINILLFALLIFAAWTTALLRSKGRSEYRLCQLIVIEGIILAITAYLVNSVWNSGYLTCDTLAAIGAQSDGIKFDTLHHVAIVQGIQNYGIPSLLINSGEFFNYHFGSHIIMAIISKWTGISAYYIYCYFYPAVFLPVYLYLILSVCSMLRLHFSGSRTFSIMDMFVVMCFVIPELPEIILYRSAIWKTSWIVSESFLVALVFMLLYFKLILLAKENGWIENRHGRNIIQFVITPFFIVFISLTKISVGALLCMGVVYYYFRKHTKEVRYWLLIVFYLILFALVYFVPFMIHSPFRSATNNTYIELFSFYKRYVYKGYRLLHFILLYYAAFLVLFWRLHKKNIIHAICNKECILEEILFWVCIAGAAPGMLLNIIGGSAAYFSYVQQLIGVILLISYGIPNELWESRKKPVLKILFPALGAILCVSLFVNSEKCVKGSFDIIKNGYENRGAGSSISQQKDVFFQPSKYASSSYFTTIQEINRLTDRHKEDYYIFVDESASVWTRFGYSDSATMFYPAMTGIVQIGALYSKDGTVFCGNDQPAVIISCADLEDTKMTLETALDKCRDDSKSALIHLYGDTFEVLAGK